MLNPRATKLMLIRHAEKPGEPPPPHGVTNEGAQDPKSLTVRGWTRAGALINFFVPPDGHFANPLLATPQVIYAVRIAPGSESHRHQQTVSPLLDKLGDRARANFEFAKGEETRMMASALACEGVVLICWEHQLLPNAAHQIPLSPRNTNRVPAMWDKERYDLVWIFDLDAASGGYIFTQIPQLLLAGDSALLL